MTEPTTAYIRGYWVATMLAIAGCTAGPNAVAPPIDELGATSQTATHNAELARRLDLEGEHDFDDARRGLLAQLETPAPIDLAADAFLDEPVPPEVTPTLWRQSRLNRIHGLFEVVPGIVQVRGYDAANLTLIEGRSGWIVIDPLMSDTPVRLAFELVDRVFGARPVSAIVITHNHVDHYGGAHAVVSRENRAVPIYAPSGFHRGAVAEHLLAGLAMEHRSVHFSGFDLPSGPTGRVGYGIAQRFTPGRSALPIPSEEIAGDTDRVIDGVPFEFIEANDTEATAEFVFYLPQHRVAHGAELVTGTQHNVLTPRGAKIRDPLRWSQVIDALLQKAEVDAVAFIASHNAPVFGRERALRRLRNHRNLYRYIHDQTLRRANAGMTMHEIANDVPEPVVMQSDLSTRPYWGNFRHNLRAVYQLYLGWWDGDLENYDPHSPVAMSQRYVAAMGGEAAVLRRGTEAFEGGDYRWAATLFGHVVATNTDNEVARTWLARTYRQLGYQQESGFTRHAYLGTAVGLTREAAPGFQTIAAGNAYPLADQLDVLATRYDASKLGRAPFVLNVTWSDDTAETIGVDVGEDVLFPRAGGYRGADFDLVLTRGSWGDIMYGDADPAEHVADPELAAALDALRSAIRETTPGN